MNSFKISAPLFLLVVMVLFTTSAFSQNSNFHVYLCFGQSNMEGQGVIEEQDKTVDNRFLMMQSTDCPNLEKTLGSWYPAIPPLSQCYTGLSPADYFGRTMVEKLPDSIKVGVINVSVGGCDIRLFDKDLYLEYDDTYPEAWFTDKVAGYGGNPYQRIIKLAKLAQKDGVIKGILLHQGETNTGDENWPLYVATVYNNMLEDLSLNAADVPLLVGEVVHENQQGKCASMNAIIATVPKVIPTAHVISSDGCSVKSDNVHFNAQGYRELGKRYAIEMLKIVEN
ncbi:sialate O-acetylesterase [Lutibacter sp. A64]|uniref:sialate O-acetylesterase n=1 Tax=Lutibacter sp. A64 TaxID=2918526 RepID=UPI001F05CB3F|nr:sialate O-acetylesterase [Lutibacter sp. A64]UMB53069.1 sialate O-acetylesterase [Lutibacter sp. A64]